MQQGSQRSPGPQTCAVLSRNRICCDLRSFSNIRFLPVQGRSPKADINCRSFFCSFSYTRASLRCNAKRCKQERCNTQNMQKRQMENSKDASKKDRKKTVATHKSCNNERYKAQKKATHKRCNAQKMQRTKMQQRKMQQQNMQWKKMQCIEKQHTHHIADPAYICNRTSFLIRDFHSGR